MARTKATARKDGRGPGIASKAAARKTARKGKPIHIMKQKRYRRFTQNANALREIRVAQKSTSLCVPKLPLQRLVREICDNWKLGFRWKSSALLCLQEAAEDFLIEIFNDICVLAAHAKRLTIMASDMNTLKMLRWRYDKLLHPSDFVDEKMLNILMIPPARAPKQNIVIQDVTHDVQTRAKVKADERRKAEENRRTVDDDPMKTFLEETEDMNEVNDNLLGKVSRGIYVYIDFQSGQKQIELEMKDIRLLTDKKALISDTIMYTAQL